MTQKGFTLIELLVVFAVIGLVIVAVPIAFSGGFAGASLKTSARLAADELRRARGRAIATNDETGVAFDPETLRYSVMPGGARGGGRFEKGTRIVLAGPAREEGVIMFFPDGSSTGGAISLSRGAGRYDIAVDWLTGRVTVGD